MHTKIRLVWGVLVLMLALCAGLAFSGCQSTSAVSTSRDRQARALSAEELPLDDLLSIDLSSTMAQPERTQSPQERMTDLRRTAPAGSLPALDEEVWVIVPPDSDVVVEPDPDDQSDSIPGTGALVGRFADELDEPQPRNVPLPLEHTAVATDINGHIASVHVTQQFHNPYDGKIEALYVFPLPQHAAINGFVMTVGDRKIRGIIREREEAEQIYQQARAQGHVASLLTQERPNVFTQHVANIEPGRTIDIDITYFHTLRYDDGWYEYVFPMVVGPRFNPPHTTAGIAALPRGAHVYSTQDTAVTYLAPNERSGHDISLIVNLMPGTTIEEIDCPSHDIDLLNDNSEQMQIALATHDTIPNRDFVLRYRIAGDQVKGALVVHRDETSNQGYFAYTLYPPRDDVTGPRQPLELVFVIDCSGSMSGEPIAQAKDAVLSALDRLEPGDTFQVIQFSSTSSQLGPQPIAATPENVRRAQRYVRRLSGQGGTMMIEGVKAALDFPHDPERLRFVVFLTDGYIGNERDILAAVHEKLGRSRIFSFGVGSSPNRYLMNRMAKLGQGAVAYLSLNDDGGAVMSQFCERIAHPVMTDIELAFEGAEIEHMTPRRVPDVFPGRPVTVLGTFTGETPSAVRVRGRSGGHTIEATVPVPPDPAEHSALPAVWARLRIAELMDRSLYAHDTDALELEQMVTSLALNHSLMSAFTSFVAVDGSRRTAGDSGTTVPIAVPVPEGVKYETTVAK